MDLYTLGWKPFFEKHFEYYSDKGYLPGRVTSEHKHIYQVYTEQGELLAKVSGKMQYGSIRRNDFPAVGDWVVMSTRLEEKRATIHAVLPRQSKFSRKVAGGNTEEQIVAANINTVFLVNALNKDFNPRRIERYLTMAWESGANPVIVLSKADLCDSVTEKVAQVEKIALGVPVYVISSVTGQGLEELNPYLTKGHTIALLGSSGAGKSTLINALFGYEVQKTKEIRQGDDKGRHATTFRKLLLLPRGGAVIDTPGLRELQLWGSEDGLQDTFQDIEYYARKCRFRDCRHMHEPRCAVKEALEKGEIDCSRYESFLKLQKELDYLNDKKEYLAEKEKREKHWRLSTKNKHR